MRSIIASLVLGLALGMLLASAWLSPDRAGAQPPPDPAGQEMAQAAEVAQRVREFERLIARAEAARIAGNCQERGRILLNVQEIRDQLLSMRLRGYPITDDGLARLLRLDSRARVSSCPPRTIQSARQEFQEALADAMRQRGRGCYTRAFTDAEQRAYLVIEQARQDLAGPVPPQVLESWRSQIRAEADLCETGSNTICPATMPSTIPPGITSLLRCRCPPGPYRGSVFGNFHYSADSGLCAAARHAGAIQEDGGSILARVGEGRRYYVGKTRNGITSRRGNAHDRTITFQGVRDPTEERLARWPICQHIFSVYPAAERQQGITCRCIAGAPGFDGAPYGSGPYTGDSSICGAARHAGVLTSDDDLVTARPAPGLDEYPASYGNGVASRRWGTYGYSLDVSAGPR